MVPAEDMSPEYPSFGDINSGDERIYEERTYNYNDGYSSGSNGYEGHK